MDPKEIDRLRLVHEQHLRKIGSFLIARYDAVICRWLPALDRLLLSCLELSESIFVVLTEEFSAVRNARRYLTALARRLWPRTREAVENRHEKRGSLHVSLEPSRFVKADGTRLTYPGLL